MQDNYELQSKIGMRFRDQELLRQALVHKSFLNENPDFPLGSNERLEFLGDAVIGLVVAEELYRRCPEYDEGSLTEIRASLVRRESLASVGNGIELGQHLYMGKGEEADGGRDRESILASGVEALLGATLLDQGVDAARNLAVRLFGHSLDAAAHSGVSKDIKSRLQEQTQAMGLGLPVYEVVKVDGPQHAKVFAVDVFVGNCVMGHGCGRRVANAERYAAAQALTALETGPETKETQ